MYIPKSQAMAVNIPKHAMSFPVMALATFRIAHAGDPDITSDFILPPNTTPDENFFTHAGFREMARWDQLPDTFKVFKVSMAEFPALNGQSVSYAVLTFPAASVNPLYTHPRSSELLFLLRGCLEVGFVDTTNKLYTQTLEQGDMFVFPKGLVHYQYNTDANNPAVAISAFGSASAATVSIPGAVFNSSISDGILAKSFETEVTTIQKIKAGLAPKA